jgi:hypothetical protein
MMLLQKEEVYKFIIGDQKEQVYQMIFSNTYHFQSAYNSLVILEKATHRWFLDFLKLIYKRVSFVFIYNMGDSTEILDQTIKTDNKLTTDHNHKTFLFLIEKINQLEK